MPRKEAEIPHLRQTKFDRPIVTEINGQPQNLIEFIFTGEFKPEMLELLVPPPIPTIRLPKEYYFETEAETIIGQNVSQWIRLRRIDTVVRTPLGWQVPGFELEKFLNTKTAKEAADIWGVDDHLVGEALRLKKIQQEWNVTKRGHFWEIPLSTINKVNASEKRTVFLAK